ncbi:MAG: hypothetical protein GF417_01490 [Candidatus Latescibacteria bacterium]|nr:hypothetical protein [Candidatus Latescibacterota bacterium]
MEQQIRKIMNDLKKYVNDRKNRDPEFAAGYKSGYNKFKQGVLSNFPESDQGADKEERPSQ